LEKNVKVNKRIQQQKNRLGATMSDSQQGKSELDIKTYFHEHGLDMTGIASAPSSSPIQNAAGYKSPRRALSCMTPERRESVLKVLRKSIPLYAAAKRRMIAENAEYSKLCIQDAFAGRLNNGLATNSKKSKMIYDLFRIQTSEWLFNSVIIASTLHTFLIFMEPANSCTASWLYYLLQLCILLVYAVDITLKMTYEGPKEYFKHDWQQLYVLNLCIHVVDILFCGCTYYANPLRPVAGVLRDRRGRKFFEVLKKMVPEMLHNMVPILFFVIIVMVICSAMFDNTVPEFESTPYTFYNWWFLVLTNDNFARLLPERLYRSMSYLFYFFPGIYIGQRFLLNLIIGDTYGTFRNYVKKQLDKERLKELQGLTKAFSALDDEGTGKIDIKVWTACIRCFQPDLPPEATALYFELMAGGEDHITVLQFLNLRSVLNFKLYFQAPSRNRVWGYIQKLWNRGLAQYNQIEIEVPKACHQWGEYLLQLAQNYHYFGRAVFVDIILLCCGFSEVVVCNLAPLGVSVSLCQLVCLAHCAEYLVRLCAANGRLGTITETSNMITIGFTIGTGICLMYYPFVNLLEVVTKIDSAQPSLHGWLVTLPYFGSVNILRGDKILLLSRMLRCLRLANLNQDLKNFNAAIVDILPALVETFSFTFIVTYIFGLLGYLLLGPTMEEWSSPLMAVVKAQQLTFMVNFLDSMEDAMEKVSPFVIVYFLSFLLLSLTVSNIALSIIIDLHANVLDMKTNKDRAGMRKKIDTVFEKMVDKARQRQVTGILMHGGKRQQSLNFKQIKMSEFQSSDVRKFITNHSSSAVTLEELEKCSRYSNINLVQFYNDQHRNHKDLNEEANFITQLHEQGFSEVSLPPGQVMFDAGTPADRVFYLVKGGVHMRRSHSPGGEDELTLHSLLFVGSEALEPQGTYRYSCVAENETVCFVFYHEDFVHRMEPEMAGMFLQKVFKSHSKIESVFTEHRRLSAKRRRSVAITSDTLATLVRYHSNERIVVPRTDSPSLPLSGSTSTHMHRSSSESSPVPARTPPVRSMGAIIGK
jgi:CRP-like cAMP-binding protein